MRPEVAEQIESMGASFVFLEFEPTQDGAATGGYAAPSSPEFREKQLARFRERDGLTFPLLSDPDATVLRAYAAYGEKKLYGKTVEGVIRSTGVVDEDGTVSHAWYNVKATGHVAKLRRDLGLE